MSKEYFYPTKEIKAVVKKDTKDKEVKKPNTSKTYIRSFKYTFLKNSNVVPIENDIVINNTDFLKYKNQYNKNLNKYFSKKHLKGLKEVVIANTDEFSDNSDGITTSINGLSYIVIAARNSDSTVIIHEACHAFQAYYIDIFNMYYKEDWLKCKKYVSDYAKTNIYEDFAETGTKYLVGDTLDYNPKYKLFSDFYNRIK